MDRKPSPLEIFMAEFMPAVEAAAVETQVRRIEEPPGVTALGDLRAPAYGNDPSELLKHRFLYRGAVCLLCGPTGVGKSALLMQAAIYWAVGRAFFGILPGEIYQQKGMRILLVQAENDEGDLVEMRDGVLAGCDDLTEEEKELARRRIQVKTVCDKSAEAFASYLEVLIIEHGPFDLVMVDPAFAYLGGDSNSQKDVSHFMRELLNPLLQKHQVGMVLAHHTNKPLRGKEKDSWAAGDFAYLGAGSAEWINPARAALAIRSVGSDSVFEFRAVKRGKRLRWVDENGNPTTMQLIAHDGRPGVICWHAATPADAADLEAAAKGGRPRKCDLLEVLHCMKAHEKQNQGFYKEAVSQVVGCSQNAVQNVICEGVKMGFIRFVEQGREKVYVVTEKGEKKASERPSPHDWTNHIPTTHEN